MDMAKLKQEVSLRELLNGGAVFDVCHESAEYQEEDEEEDIKYREALTNFVNLNCVGEFEEDDGYNDSEPFEKIGLKMTELLPSGLIKKRVLRKGYGDCPNENSLVKVHYNSYVEYEAEPFDSTYVRNSPHEFVIEGGQVLPGLDIAVQSMQLNEKSQFLIAPELAYGKLGCLNRIPANATILFEIELIEIIEAGAAEKFDTLPEDKKKDFVEVYKYCQALVAKGKESFTHGNYRAAIRKYNTAVGKLEFAQLHEYEDQVKQQELLIKLYSNLLVCHVKCEEPKKGCLNFNKINEMARGTNLEITAKMYYNNAKCLRMLGNFNLAKTRLKKANDLAPKNPDILAEFKIIDIEQQKHFENEKKMSKAFVSGS